MNAVVSDVLEIMIVRHLWASAWPRCVLFATLPTTVAAAEIPPSVRPALRAIPALGVELMVIVPMPLRVNAWPGLVKHAMSLTMADVQSKHRFASNHKAVFHALRVEITMIVMAMPVSVSAAAAKYASWAPTEDVKEIRRFVRPELTETHASAARMTSIVQILQPVNVSTKHVCPAMYRTMRDVEARHRSVL